MTTEDDFHAAIDRDPGDAMARLALADWLDENAGDVECPACGGEGRINQHWDPASDTLRGGKRCPACDGTGTVSDGRRERAAGYRALGELGMRPSHLIQPHWYWWRETERRLIVSLFAILPDVWYAAVACKNISGHWLNFDTRREAEDAAALAFGRLPPDVQARILAGATAAC